jgi:hypothetical protein
MRCAVQSRRRRELDEVERKVARVIRATEDGAWSEALKARLTELEGRKARLREDLAAADLAEGPEVRIHPGTTTACGRIPPWATGRQPMRSCPQRGRRSALQRARWWS